MQFVVVIPTLSEVEWGGTPAFRSNHVAKRRTASAIVLEPPRSPVRTNKPPSSRPERSAVERPPYLPLASAATALAATLAYATTTPSSQLFGPILTAPPHPQQLALTFDDGPNPTATPYLLDLLASHNVRATFFLIGRYALSQKSLARRILAEGHTLGNHTMSHPRLPLCTHARITADLRDAQHAITDITGAPIRLFRPPHGYRTPFVLKTARSLGLTTTTWNLIANDWKLPTAEAITARILTGIARNQRRRHASNIVLHDGSQTSPTADRSRSLAATANLLAAHQQARFITLDAWL